MLQKLDSQEMFNGIAKRYDFLNRILSFGLDGLWRNSMRQELPSKNGLKVLDLATGTADVAIAMAGQENVLFVVGVDLSEGMLDIGRAKIKNLGLSDKIDLKKADAQDLPFEDESFDVVTLSFGLRNFPNMMQGLCEIYRVLKPGGIVCVLEFSVVRNKILRIGQTFYLGMIVPMLGFIFSGNYSAYQYLNRTITSFPLTERLNRIIAQVGFSATRYRELCLGVAAVHVGRK